MQVKITQVDTLNVKQVGHYIVLSNFKIMIKYI